jgi:tRNA(Ile)-lysidine synthase TilS/MesJ
MINDGDRIAVGISGGKDSLALLTALVGLRRFYPNKFEIYALTVSLGFPEHDFSPVVKFCKELSVEYEIIETDIGAVVFEERAESNPCSLCAKMRKGALNDAAKRAGCNKVAYGHNRDDVTETFLMSLIYEGRIHTFRPVTYLDRMDLTVIRPLIYTPERNIRSFAKGSGLPVVPSCCPVDGRTKRQTIKEFIKARNGEFKGFEEKVFGAIRRSKIDGW